MPTRSGLEEVESDRLANEEFDKPKILTQNESIAGSLQKSWMMKGYTPTKQFSGNFLVEITDQFVFRESA
jgi:hypothetical protein